MKEGKVESNNRGLVILLCVLGVAIVGLAAGIVLVGGGNKAEEEPQISEAQQSRDEYVAYVEDYYTVRDRVSKLLDSGLASADEIIEIYSDYVDEGSMFLLAEYEDLLRGGFKREALDALTGTDFSDLSEPDQYRWYSIIISLAGELGDEGILRKYESLLAGVKAAYDANYAASESAAAKYEALEKQGEIQEDKDE